MAPRDVRQMRAPHKQVSQRMYLRTPKPQTPNEHILNATLGPSPRYSCIVGSENVRFGVEKCITPPPANVTAEVVAPSQSIMFVSRSAVVLRT